MSPRRRSSDRKFKNSHHSKYSRNRKSNGNSTEFTEPTLLPHSNNVPFLVQTPIYDPLLSTSNQGYPFGYVIPPTLPTQHSIGQLYVLTEHKPTKEYPVIPEKSNSININEPMQKEYSQEQLTNVRKQEKPNFMNMVQGHYHSPTQSEALHVNNTWKSQNLARKIINDTYNQYEYEIPTFDRMASCFSTRYPLVNNENNSEITHLSSPQCNESWKSNKEKESDDSGSAKYLQQMAKGNLTVLRVTNCKDNNQCEKFSHKDETSKLPRDIRMNPDTFGKDIENYNICYGMPTELNHLNKEKNTFNNLKSGVACDLRKINCKSGFNKRMNIATDKCTRRNPAKYRTFRRMPTEDLISDLYRKIDDIQSAIGASTVNGLLARKVNHQSRAMGYPVPSRPCVYPRNLTHYDSDTVVTGTNYISRGVSPINFRSIENAETCCFCCHQRKRNAKQIGLSTPSMTGGMHTLPEFSNHHYEFGSWNDGIHHVYMHYPQMNPPFQPDIDFREESSPENKNIRIVIDHEAKCQSPSTLQTNHVPGSLPMQEICIRPCYCFQNTESNDPNAVNPISYSDLGLCTPQVIPPKLHTTPTPKKKRIDGKKDLPRSQRSARQNQSCNCPSNHPNPCHCDFNKVLSDIMDKIEHNLTLKLKRKSLSTNDNPLDQSLRDNQDDKKHKLIDTEQNTFENHGDALPPRTVIIDNSNIIIKENYESQKEELDDVVSSSKYPTQEILNQDVPPMRDAGVNPRFSRGGWLRGSAFSSDRPRESGIIDNVNRGASEFANPNSIRVSTRPSMRENVNRTSRFWNPMPRGQYRGSEINRGAGYGFPGVGFGYGFPGYGYHGRGLRRSGYRGSGFRNNGLPYYPYRPSVFHVFTAIPTVENVIESSMDKTDVSKDDMLSNIHFGKFEKKFNSYQIRRIRFSGSEKHIYISAQKEGKKCHGKRGKKPLKL
ncbi:uncharacterized protein [Halyomorpha halys]|uniref:uncharacterized protein isoform X2 n=1 Tax=Halyomorpha halys TaxID=286706 RepID=UPI0006D52995|nr:uncharacterized protein LOC106689233 isoform X2 [Halyomorpha halys]